jgi:hypothetical protein
MAVGAQIVRNRRLKIPAHVTAQTLNLCMFPEQRETGLCVIEASRKTRPLPRGRCVAGLATLLERSVVRVAMTIGTARERQPCVSSMAIRPRCMAALALHLLVLSRQRILRLRMVKSLLVDACRLPIRG